MHSNCPCLLALALPAALAAQTVTASATGAIRCSQTTTSTGTTSQALPPGSPLPNGTTISTNMSSVTIGLALGVSPTVRARYSTTESVSEFYSPNPFPPASSGAGSTGCTTALTVTSTQPMPVLLHVTWTTNLNNVTGVANLGVDFDNDGIADWQPAPHTGVQTTTFSTLLDVPRTVLLFSSAQSYSYGPSSSSTMTSQVVLDVEAVPPRCTGTAYSVPCGSSLVLADLGGGMLQIAPTLNSWAPGDPAALVLGLQQQAVPLPLSTGCTLAVVPAAVLLLVTGTAPPAWTLDGRAPIGPFAFDVQVVHLNAGQSFASNAVAVSCQ